MKERIKGYISFEELEHYCQQNIDAIEAGNKNHENVIKDYPNSKILSTKSFDWSKGKQKAWKELQHSIQNWKKADEEGK